MRILVRIFASLLISDHPTTIENIDTYDKRALSWYVLTHNIYQS